MANKYSIINGFKDKDILKDILSKYPEAKDNDELLIAIVWKLELANNGFNSTNLDIKDFFGLLASQDISKPETITRLRRKVQEEFPEYRGEKYAKRHNHTEEVKSDLGYGPNNQDTFTPKQASNKNKGNKSSKIIL